MRKWTYLVATLLMAGTTATFTGCIDTDEPEGIVNLRGAKSELIKAQSALELVEAELKKAQVAEQELINAGLALQNKSAEIDLQLHELDIQLKQLLIEKEEAATAQAKAEAEAAIAKAEADKTKWENEKALIVEQYKEKMLLAETATAKAQDAYKQAMEQIEASKVLLTEEEQIRLSYVQCQVAYAKRAMDIALYGYSTTELRKKEISSTTSSETTVTTKPGEENASSEETTTSATTKRYIYYIVEVPSNAKDGFGEGSLKKLQEELAEALDGIATNNIEAKLENAKVLAELDLKAAQKTADELKAILDNDYTEIADWEAQVTKLEEEIAALKIERKNANIERDKHTVTDKELVDKKDAAQTVYDEAKTALDGHTKDKVKAAEDYSTTADGVIVADLTTAAGTGVIGYSKGTFKYTASKHTITDAQEIVDDWIALVDKATAGINLNDIAWSKIALEDAKKAATDAGTTYTTDLDAWTKAVKAYQESLKIDLKKSETDVKAAMTKYNALKDDDRKNKENLKELGTALASYYKDVLAVEGKVCQSTRTIENVNKSLSEWLIEDPENIMSFDNLIVTWESGKIKSAAKLSDKQMEGLLKLEDKEKSSAKAILTVASKTVFGEEFDTTDGNPRLEPVTENDVLAAIDKTKDEAWGEEDDLSTNKKYGTLGAKIYAESYATHLDKIVKQSDIYKALRDEFVAQKAAEDAIFNKAVEKLKTTLADAQTKLDEATAAYDKVFKEFDDKITELKAEIKIKGAISDKINKRIAGYLESNFDDYEEGQSLDDIKAAIEKEYRDELETVLEKEAALAQAKRNIEKLAEGTYTDEDVTESITSIQNKIAVQQAEYDAAKAEYDTVSAQLKELLAIFLK